MEKWGPCAPIEFCRHPVFRLRPWICYFLVFSAFLLFLHVYGLAIHSCALARSRISVWSLEFVRICVCSSGISWISCSVGSFFSLRQLCHCMYIASAFACSCDTLIVVLSILPSVVVVLSAFVFWSVGFTLYIMPATLCVSAQCFLVLP